MSLVFLWWLIALTSKQSPFGNHDKKNPALALFRARGRRFAEANGAPLHLAVIEKNPAEAGLVSASVARNVGVHRYIPGKTIKPIIAAIPRRSWRPNSAAPAEMEQVLRRRKAVE